MSKPNTTTTTTTALLDSLTSAGATIDDVTVTDDGHVKIQLADDGDVATSGAGLIIKGD